MTVTATRGCIVLREVLKMYIPEFWCGVVATIVLEIVAAIAGTIYVNHKKKGDSDNE
ncbi:MAG: hypothetical protein KBT03_01010 [Bacteroidales bacterium]|nr:hypothetical protein [Candidatus Scybalousia scybalohippi]